MVGEIDISTYLNGASLNEALVQFTTPELIDAYETLCSARCAPSAEPANPSFATALTNVANTLLQHQQWQNKYSQTIQAMKADIINQIKTGDLMAYGYLFPRNLADKPVQVPADIFISGKVNWDNSELEFRSMEFTGIRIVDNENPVIEIKAIKHEITENRAVAVMPKLIAANNDPEKYINEKEAADFLGLSFRTLQGYRSAGGGPQFLKLQKAVRYKIADLIAWTEDNKKANTSQY